MQHRSLNPEKIAETAERLSRRIYERFPVSGLYEIFAELIRYLDYCSELLSLASKIAAACIQRFNDSVVLAEVSDVETLCTGLSSKIRQKMQIADSVFEDAALRG